MQLASKIWNQNRIFSAQKMAPIRAAKRAQLKAKMAEQADAMRLRAKKYLESQRES